MLLDDAQHVAAQEGTAIRRDRTPRGLVEEINAVGKREMETARAMPFLVALARFSRKVVATFFSGLRETLWLPIKFRGVNTRQPRKSMN